MAIVNEILLWLHLIGLGMGGAAIVGGVINARLLPAATAEQRATIFQAAAWLERVGRAALGLLIVTGLLMLWLKWGGVVPNGTWFAIKMVLVLVVIVALVIYGRAFRRFRNGDAAAQPLVRQGRLAGSIAFVLVVLAAVLAFN
jgi:uncharacterized membrane protein